ncbi:hypothetical protein WG66_013225 [Moniliophthora roreri]|nr:hypothetical protein WG66_013225 [Moniliophthora roreri]
MELNIYERYKSNPADVWQREEENEEAWLCRINPCGARLNYKTVAFLKKPKEGQTIEDWSKKFQDGLQRYRQRSEGQHSFLHSKTIAINSIDSYTSTRAPPSLSMQGKAPGTSSRQPNATNTSPEVTAAATTPLSQTLHLRFSGQYLTTASSTSTSQNIHGAPHPPSPISLSSCIANSSSAPARANQYSETDNSEVDKEILQFFKSLHSITREFSNGKLQCFESRISKLQQENQKLVISNEELQDKLQTAQRAADSTRDKLGEQVRRKDQELQALKREMEGASNKLEQETSRLLNIVEVDERGFVSQAITRGNLKRKYRTSRFATKKKLQTSQFRPCVPAQNLQKAEQMDSQKHAAKELICTFESDMIKMQKQLQLFREAISGSEADLDLIYPSDSEPPVKRRRYDT